MLTTTPHSIQTKFDNTEIRKTKKELISSIIKFFFPLWPHKVLKNLSLMMCLSILLALRLVLGRFVIYIPGITLSVSIAWTPLIIIGWIFGPILGLIMGVITDTLAFFISPSGTWFWLYAIQEPALGLLAGIIGSFCNLRIKQFQRTQNKKSLIFEFLFFQIVLIGFLTISFFVLINTLENAQRPFAERTLLSDFLQHGGYYVILSGLVIFFLVAEFLYLIFLFKYKKPFILTTYIITATILFSIVFSFALGPISANEFFKYINGGRSSNSYITYGAIFYLIPRIIKESLKAPVQAMLLLALIPLTQAAIERNINLISKKWTSQDNKWFKINR